jgi:hypothetical protein
MILKKLRKTRSAFKIFENYSLLKKMIHKFIMVSLKFARDMKTTRITMVA